MVCKVKVAAFQADSLISYRYIHNKSNLIIGNDTDFAALVGKGALVITNFKFNRDMGGHNRNRIDTIKLKNIEIEGSSNKLMNVMKLTIQKNMSAAECKNIKWEHAKYPLFEIENVYIRSQVAVCIGCDVLVRGIKGCGPGTVHKPMENFCNKIENSEEKFRSR